MADRDSDEAEVAAAWNRNAATWADSVRAGFDLYREHFTFPAFLKFLPPIEGLEVIDLGCGEGTNTRRFAGLGADMTGVDLSEAMIARARAVEAEAPLGIRYEVCSYSGMAAMADASFDAALSTMALMDGPDLAGAMREAHRVLRPGGRLCFSILHPCFVTPVMQWLKTPEGAHEALKVGQYFDGRPFTEFWRFSKHAEAQRLPPFEVPRFPRTLSDYLNALCDAGFRLVRLEEPRPEAAAAAAHPWLSRWRAHAALVLFVAAEKP